MRARDREASSPVLEGRVQRPHGEGKKERGGLKLRLRERNEMKEEGNRKVKEHYKHNFVSDWY